MNNQQRSILKLFSIVTLLTFVFIVFSKFITVAGLKGAATVTGWLGLAAVTGTLCASIEYVVQNHRQSLFDRQADSAKEVN